jgi:hypothetical protein
VEAMKLGRQRFNRVSTALADYAVSKAKLYDTARKHKNLFRKDGKVVWVDYDLYDKIIAASPPATISPLKKRA